MICFLSLCDWNGISLRVLAKRCRKRCRASHWESYFVGCLNGKQIKERFPTPLSLETLVKLSQWKKECTSKGVAVVMKQRCCSHNKQHQCILCPLERRRCGIAFLSVSHSGGTQNSLSSGSQKSLSCNHAIIYTDECFSITKTHPKGWLWSWYKRCIFTTHIITILCFHLESGSLGAAWLCDSSQLANAIPLPLAEGWILAMKQFGFFTTDRINIFCLHWRVEGLDRHCCLSHIRWQTKKAFKLMHRYISYNLDMYKTRMELFQLQKNINTHSMWWL